MLQLLQLMKSAAQLIWALRISDAVYTTGSIVLMVQRHVTICNLALVVHYVAKSVIQLSKQARCPARHNALYRIFTGRCPGLSEVADDLGLMAFVFRVERRTQGDQYSQHQ